MARHSERFRVGWIDTDASGRIHFSAPFRWIEAAEISLYRNLGLLDGTGDAPRRRIECEYRVALVFEDVVDVELRVEKVGRTSVTFEWTVLRGGEIAITGSHVVVYVDPEGRPTPIPDGERDALLAD